LCFRLPTAVQQHWPPPIMLKSNVLLRIYN
jgi:hypothetical protein